MTHSNDVRPGTAATNQTDTNGSLRLLACQLAIPETKNRQQRDRHLARSQNLVSEQLQSKPVDVVVLPELSSIDYSRKSFEQLEVLGESDRGASFSCWSEIAREFGCAVVYGFARRVGDEYRISTAVVSAKGELQGIYDKLHLAQFGDSMEKEYFNSAGHHLLVFTVAGFRIAPIICYDVRFPELCRELVTHHDVDLILHVGAYARDESFYSWHAFAVTRAVENQCFMLSLNRAGLHFGQSVFCEPWIDQHSPPMVFDNENEQCHHIVLEKRKLINARSNYTFLDDRLDDYKLPLSDETFT